MPLTPEDVSNKRFTPVRLREGYDMGEVDQFLDEVEAELARMLKDNEDLREQLAAAEGESGAVAPVRAPAATDATATQDATTDAGPATDEQPAADEKAAVAAPARPLEEIRVTTGPEASAAATRLLEIATRNADELVEGARAEADTILGGARQDAERLHADSKERADKVEADARTRSESLDSETADRRQQLFGDLEKEKGRLDHEIENLRTFEREYRSRLKSYFTQQLQSLEGGHGNGVADDAPAATDGDPQRARTALDEG